MFVLCVCGLNHARTHVCSRSLSRTPFPLCLTKVSTRREKGEVGVRSSSSRTSHPKLQGRFKLRFPSAWSSRHHPGITGDHPIITPGSPRHHPGVTPSSPQDHPVITPSSPRITPGSPHHARPGPPGICSRPPLLSAPGLSRGRRSSRARPAGTPRPHPGAPGRPGGSRATLNRPAGRTAATQPPRTHARPAPYLRRRGGGRPYFRSLQRDLASLCKGANRERGAGQCTRCACVQSAHWAPRFRQRLGRVGALYRPEEELQVTAWAWPLLSPQLFVCTSGFRESKVWC